jgi:hypothetical protein
LLTSKPYARSWLGFMSELGSSVPKKHLVRNQEILLAGREIHPYSATTCDRDSCDG